MVARRVATGSTPGHAACLDRLNSGCRGQNLGRANFEIHLGASNAILLRRTASGWKIYAGVPT